MNFRSFVAAPAYGFLRVRRILAGNGDPAGSFRVLIFHGVTAEQQPGFDRLLGFIGKRFGFLSPEDAAARLAGNRESQPPGPAPCLLSFDDGFQSNAGIVAPILDRHGVTALFFVCPGLIDLEPSERGEAVRRAMFRGRPPADVEPLMDWDAIRALQQAGHTIGAHSTDHRRLAGLDPASMAAAVGPDGDRIEAETGKRPDWFAYPFGDIDSIDGDALAHISRRYRYCRSGVRGLNSAGSSPLAVCADHVDLDGTFAWQKLSVSGGLWGRYRSRRRTLRSYAAGTGHNAAP